MPNSMPSNKADSVSTILQSPDILARIAALILAVTAMMIPAFGVNPEVFEAHRNANAIGILPHTLSAPAVLPQPVGLIMLIFIALIALSVLLKTMPAVVQYARLSDVIAVILGGISVVTLLGVMFQLSERHGNLPTGYMSSARRIVANAIYPAFGTWALIVSVLIMLTSLALPYVWGRRAAV